MSSLDHIMNTDDDLIDQSSASRTPRRPPVVAAPTDPSSSSSKTTSLYHDASLARSTAFPPSASYVDQATASSFPSSSLMNRPSNPLHQSSRLSVSDASTPTSPSRRRSNTTDSLDSPYASSSGTMMRPFTGSMGGVEQPVKLTPITKKISKAKKGVPVHNCDQCDKTFTRAEHLRRHQLSHSGPDLPCSFPGCGKTFHRKDLLERHRQRHEQEERSARDSRQGFKRSGSAKGSGHQSQQHHGSLHRDSGLQMPEAFVTQHPTPAPSSASGTPALQAGPWAPLPSAPNSTPQQHPGSSPNLPDGTENYTTMAGVPHTNYVLNPTMATMPATTESFVLSEPRGMPEPLYIPDPATLPWQDTPGLPSSASESTFSTPSDNTRRHRFPVRTSSGEWTMPVASYHQPVATAIDESGGGGAFSVPLTYSASASPPPPHLFVEGLGLMLPGYAEDNAFYGSDQMPTTVRSMSPQLAMAQTSETLVSVSSGPPPPGRFPNAAVCGTQCDDGTGVLGARDMVPVSLSPAIRESIPLYLDVYWEKVDPMYPIVQRPLFDSLRESGVEQFDVLQCAMAALATQYLSAREHRVKGVQLHDYAWHKSKLFTQSDDWSNPIMLTMTLCEYYNRFRGRKNESYKPSRRFNSLYQRVLTNQNAFAPTAAGGDVAEQWRCWVDMETRRRILAACFLLDVHGAFYYEQRPLISRRLESTSSTSQSLPIPLLTGSTLMWEASNAHDWSDCRTEQNTAIAATTTLCNINLEVIGPPDIASMIPFDRAIILAALGLELSGSSTSMDADLIDNSYSTQQHAHRIAEIFPDSAVANTYIALQYTPLHCLLSVSGDTWLFNKKVTEASRFSNYEKHLCVWRRSHKAATAAIFAARALKGFLNLDDGSDTVMTNAQPRTCLNDISDYWGIYVCTLICWAFGYTGKRDKMAESQTEDKAVQWILTVANAGLAEALNFSSTNDSKGVVMLARAELAADCLGKGNFLFVDAVRVLKRLEKADKRKWF